MLPTEQALERLPQAGTVFDLSKIFREFLGEQYPVSPRFSESEMISALQKLNLSAEDLRTVQNLLEKLGEIKFTGQSSGLDLKQIQNEIIHFVENKRVVGSPA